MTELRQKMIRAMELRNLSKHSQRAYLAAVTGIARHYRRSPDKITNKMIEDYLLYLKNEKDNAPNSCGSVLTGLRFFYKNVMKKEISVDYSVRKIPRKLPTVLTKKQVWKIICTPNNLKHRLILMTTYAAGLRANSAILCRRSRHAHPRPPSNQAPVGDRHDEEAEPNQFTYYRTQVPGGLSGHAVWHWPQG